MAMSDTRGRTIFAAVRNRLRGSRPGTAASAVGTPASPEHVWPKSVADADPTLRFFVAAASDVPGVQSIAAKTDGPRLGFLLIIADRPWADVVGELEPKLRTLYLSGLSSFDYDLRQADDPEPVLSGFETVFERAPALFRR